MEENISHNLERSFKMTHSDHWQMYTMSKRNAYVWLALGKLNQAMQATRDSLIALQCLRRLGDNRVWRMK
jgi:hypothetical protein